MPRPGTALDAMITSRKRSPIPSDAFCGDVNRGLLPVKVTLSRFTCIVLMHRRPVRPPASECAGPAAPSARVATMSVDIKNYGDADKKLIKKLTAAGKFDASLDQKLNIEKVNVEVMVRWVNERLTELLGFEDDVVVNLVENMLTQTQDAFSGQVKRVDPKQLQIQLTGFLDRQAAPFVAELWKLLLDAQDARIRGLEGEVRDAKRRLTAEHEATQRLQARLDALEAARGEPAVVSPPAARRTRATRAGPAETDPTPVFQYPPGVAASDSIVVTRGDLRRLEPDEFLNDNLVDFYLKVIVADARRSPLGEDPAFGDVARDVHAFSSTTASSNDTT